MRVPPLLSTLLLAALAACAAPHQQSGLNHASSESLIVVADEARRSGNLETAYNVYQRAVAADADSYQAQIGFADVATAVGRLEDAEKGYHAALGLKPSSTAAAYGLARLQLGRSDPKGAIATCDRSLDAGGVSAELYDLKGVALDLLGRHLEAQAVYSKGLAMDPEDRRLRNNYGLSLAATHDFAKALDILQALANDPQATVKNRQNLALVLGMSGNVTAARALAAKDLPPGQVDENAQFYEAAENAPRPSL